MSGSVELTRVGESACVAVLTFARPEKANAYNEPMLARFRELLRALAADASVRAIVVTGAGKHFCAGADRAELDQRRGEDALDLASRLAFDELACMPQPVVAAIGGAAVGGGFELALACDLRLCTPDAHFALPETELGLIPAAG